MTRLLYATGTREFFLSPSYDFSWWLDVGIGAVSSAVAPKEAGEQSS